MATGSLRPASFGDLQDHLLAPACVGGAGVACGVWPASRQRARRKRDRRGGVRGVFSFEDQVDAQVLAREFLEAAAAAGRTPSRLAGRRGPRRAVRSSVRSRGSLIVPSRSIRKRIIGEIGTDSRRLEPVHADRHEHPLDVVGIVEVGLIEGGAADSRRCLRCRRGRRSRACAEAAPGAGGEAGLLGRGLGLRSGARRASSSLSPWPAAAWPSARGRAAPPRPASRSWASRGRARAAASTGGRAAGASRPARAAPPTARGCTKMAGPMQAPRSRGSPARPAWSRTASEAPIAQGRSLSLSLGEDVSDGIHVTSSCSPTCP